jgi:hypothetical protein
MRMETKIAKTQIRMYRILGEKPKRSEITQNNG